MKRSPAPDNTADRYLYAAVACILCETRDLSSQGSPRTPQAVDCRVIAPGTSRPSSRQERLPPSPCARWTNDPRGKACSAWNAPRRRWDEMRTRGLLLGKKKTRIHSRRAADYETRAWTLCLCRADNATADEGHLISILHRDPGITRSVQTDAFFEEIALRRPTDRWVPLQCRYRVYSVRGSFAENDVENSRSFLVRRVPNGRPHLLSRGEPWKIKFPLVYSHTRKL